MNELVPDALPLGVPQALHPAIRKVWQISTLIAGIILIVALGGFELILIHHADGWPLSFPLIGPLVGILKTGIGWVIADRQYQRWTYEMREHDLVLSHGLVWRNRRCVSRDRVQHIDINSGPLDRRFGLVQVSIYAAGALGGIGSIPGLTPEKAELLRVALLERRAADA